ncbi:MAG: trigger factor [Planctomycetia bacterium]|nr:trigger factor [Planctomycetia bacterium]MBL6915936.1 trigger factor [Planctomycetota bacterium]
MNDDTNGAEGSETEVTNMNTSATENPVADAGTDSQDFIASNIELVDEGACRKRLKITISQETVSSELETNFRQLKNSVMLPGFRQGKVPLAILKKRFNDQVQEDVREDLKGRSVEEQFEAADYKPLGFPEFENVEFSADKPFTFEAVFDVQPTFELPEYKNIEIDSEVVPVEDADVAAEVDRICEQSATLEPLEVGQQAEGDFVVVDIDLQVEGESIFSKSEVVMKVGDDFIDSMEISGLSKDLAGAAQDATFEKSVEVPQDFPEAEHREKSGSIHLTVRDAKKMVTPELDEEFLGRLGVESEEDLRNKVREGMEGRRIAEENTRQEDLLSEKVADSVEMELPESMVSRRKDSLVRNKIMEMMREGASEEDASAEAEKDEEMGKQARLELVRIFVLDKIADEEKVFVTEDEVVQRLQAIASTYQRPLEEVLEQYRSGGMIPELRNGMKREKVKQLLRKKAKVSGS